MSDEQAASPAPETARQLRILTSGVDRIVPEDEFVRKLDRAVATGTGLRVKLGIDPSSPDIHIGHGVPLRMLRRFQQLGHTAVLIIGDFTGQVGDPTGRSDTRRALTEDEVRENGRTYEAQAKRILLPERLEVVRNSEWLGALGTSGLLQLASRMTVARMLERDDFSKRYTSGKPISIVEFMYPLLQGHDSVVVRA
ncbi:MAG TPA: tyrosine--tRNA ligase, partial [Actinomycetota bacterium]